MNESYRIVNVHLNSDKCRLATNHSSREHFETYDLRKSLSDNIEFTLQS